MPKNGARGVPSRQQNGSIFSIAVVESEPAA
jgi:hypothetical protein